MTKYQKDCDFKQETIHPRLLESWDGRKTGLET